VAPPARRRGWRPGIPAALLGHRDFTLLWSGQAVSQFGTRIYGVASILWVLAVTGSVRSAGAVGSVTLGAFAVAQLPAGWLADRLDRRTIMVACDATSAIAALSLGLAAATAWFDMAQVLAAAVVLGTGWAVRGTAESVSLGDVLPADDLAGAGALMSARGHAAGLAGPPVASGLFRLWPALPFLVDGVSYLIALVSGASVRAKLRTPDGQRAMGSARAEMVGGMRAFWSVRFLRTAVALDSAAAFASNALALVVIVMLREARRRRRSDWRWGWAASEASPVRPSPSRS
jgi:MFS family permease